MNNPHYKPPCKAYDKVVKTPSTVFVAHSQQPDYITGSRTVEGRLTLIDNLRPQTAHKLQLFNMACQSLPDKNNYRSKLCQLALNSKGHRRTPNAALTDWGPQHDDAFYYFWQLKHEPHAACKVNVLTAEFEKVAINSIQLPVDPPSCAIIPDIKVALDHENDALPYFSGTVRRYSKHNDGDLLFDIFVKRDSEQQGSYKEIRDLNIGQDTETVVKTKFQCVGVQIPILVDCGSSVCTCSLQLAEATNAHVIRLDKPMSLIGFDGQRQTSALVAIFVIDIHGNNIQPSLLTREERRLTTTSRMGHSAFTSCTSVVVMAVITENSSEHLLLGINFIQRHFMTINRNSHLLFYNNLFSDDDRILVRCLTGTQISSSRQAATQLLLDSSNKLNPRIQNILGSLPGGECDNI